MRSFRHDDCAELVLHAGVTRFAPIGHGSREINDSSRQLLDAFPLPIWMSGVDGECAYVNRAWVDLIGQPADRALDQGWREVVHPGDRTRCLDVYRHAFEAREPFSMEYRMRQHNGQYGWWREDGVPRYEEEAGFLGYIGSITDVTERRRLEMATRDLSSRLINAQEEERARIGRELHDDVSQRLALISIDVDELWKLLPAGASQMAARVAKLRAASRDLAREVHGLSHQLHSTKLAALGLVPALRGHCREVSERSIQVQFSNANVPNTLARDAALCVFRVAQEALANVVKHSGATDARVMVAGGDGEIVLRVEDGGRGFNPDSLSDGLGLVSMRERVHSVGGDIKVRSTPNRGTVIEARVPVHASPLKAARSQPAA